MNSRQNYNLQILDQLETFLLAHPEIRFIQALWNLNLINKKENEIEDRFYEESDKTLKRIKKIS